MSTSKLTNIEYVSKVLLKSIANLPHSDFLLCKSLLSTDILEEPTVLSIQFLNDLLETCSFKEFWEKARTAEWAKLTRAISGFEDSMRRYVCHVISTTYQRIPEERLCELLGLSDEKIVNQWIEKNGWTTGDNYVTISNQDESIKTKKITEKIDLESVAGIMASCF
jgi:translation initiation factor 3 subunit K